MRRRNLMPIPAFTSQISIHKAQLNSAEMYDRNSTQTKHHLTNQNHKPHKLSLILRLYDHIKQAMNSRTIAYSRISSSNRAASSMERGSKTTPSSAISKRLPWSAAVDRSTGSAGPRFRPAPVLRVCWAPPITASGASVRPTLRPRASAAISLER